MALNLAATRRPAVPPLARGSLCVVMLWMLLETVAWIGVSDVTTGQRDDVAVLKAMLAGGISSASMVFGLLGMLAIQAPLRSRFVLWFIGGGSALLMESTALDGAGTWLVLLLAPLAVIRVVTSGACWCLLRHHQRPRPIRSIKSMMMLTFWTALTIAGSQVATFVLNLDEMFLWTTIALSLAACLGVTIILSRRPTWIWLAQPLFLVFAVIVMAVMMFVSPSGQRVELGPGMIALLISHAAHTMLFLFLLRSAGYRLG